jgi:hypothetical protein
MDILKGAIWDGGANHSPPPSESSKFMGSGGGLSSIVAVQRQRWKMDHPTSSVKVTETLNSDGDAHPGLRRQNLPPTQKNQFELEVV